MTAPPEHDGPTDEQFRRTMAWFVTGVAVMTAVGADGQPHGMTANAVSSVSLDPPLVLVCVDRSATMLDVVRGGQLFALTYLAADQERVSEHFADPGRGYGISEFADIGWHTGVTGAPLLDGGAAWMDCEVHDVLPGGDHDVVLGRVVHTAVAASSRGALIYTPDGYDVWGV